jgi:hypothetical protein
MPLFEESTLGDVPRDSEAYAQEAERLTRSMPSHEQRVSDTLRILSAGGHFLDVKAYAAEQGWNCTDRTIFRYIRKAYQQIEKLLEKDRGKLLSKALIQRETVYARAMESGDWRAALACLDSREKLLGLFPAKQVHVAGSGLVQLHIEELVVRAPEALPPRPEPLTIEATSHDDPNADNPTLPPAKAVS